VEAAEGSGRLKAFTLLETMSEAADKVLVDENSFCP
jgi:hypothetical protein